MSAVIANIYLQAGEDKEWDDTIYQADGTTIQDITGWSLKFIVFPVGVPPLVIAQLTKTTGAGITIPVGTDGVCHITVNAADTIDLNPGQYEWRIFRTDTGEVAVLTEGYMTIGQ